MNTQIALILLKDLKEEFLSRPAIQRIKECGYYAPLSDQPIIATRAIEQQILSGCNPGKTGIFDATFPENYTTRTFARVNGERNLIEYLKEKSIPVFASLDTIKDEQNALYLIESDWDSIENRFEALQERFNNLFIVIPTFCIDSVKRVNINNFLKEKEIIELDKDGKILWEESLAYHTGNGQVWINMEGREPQGIVSPGEEYEEVRDALIKGIENKLVDPENGEPVIKKVYKKEELYSGDLFFKMPDLIVQLKPNYVFSEKGRQLQVDEFSVFQKQSRAYTPGCMIAVGDQIAHAIQNSPLRPIDIAPILTYLMGQPIPSWMDGKVAEQAIQPQYLHQNPITYADDSFKLSKEDEAIIAERLKSLGYLE